MVLREKRETSVLYLPLGSGIQEDVSFKRKRDRGLIPTLSYPRGLTVLVMGGIESRVGVRGDMNIGYSMDLLVLMFIWV
jgi:hypothetical protein